MKDWYEGKVVSGDITKTARVKLDLLELVPKGDANTYIDRFLELKKHLEDVGENECLNMLIERFLNHIKDPLYEITVTNMCMNGTKTLDYCIEAIHQQM